MIRDVLQFPLPRTSQERLKAVERLVDRILATKKHDPEADTTVLEREIDSLVYDLYALIPEDVALVEKGTS